jgi:hypothetical protein
MYLYSYGLFNDAVNSPEYLSLNYGWLVNNEPERMRLMSCYTKPCEGTANKQSYFGS